MSDQREGAHFLHHIFLRPRTLAILGSILAIAFIFDNIVAGIATCATIVGIICLMCWRESYVYIKSRKDLYDGTDYKIRDSWGDKFLVALLNDKVKLIFINLRNVEAI